jgi:hypothetical protein
MNEYRKTLGISGIVTSETALPQAEAFTGKLPQVTNIASAFVFLDPV